MAYKLNMSIAIKYALLINKSGPIYEQTSKSSFPVLHEGGAMNIDLWVSSSLYPINLANGRRPQFQNIVELLEFIGDKKSSCLDIPLHH